MTRDENPAAWDRELASILTEVCAASGVDANGLTEDTVRLYQRHLGDLDAEALRTVAQHVIRQDPFESCRYKRLPTVAEWRQLIEPVLGVGEVLERLRWFKTQHCFHRHYAGEVGDFDRLVFGTLGGLPSICDSLTADRERFLVEKHLPEWLDLARAREWELPGRDFPLLPVPTRQKALPPPTETPSVADDLRNVVRHIGRVIPDPAAEALRRFKLAAAERLAENAVAPVPVTPPAPRREQTPEELAARKALLAEQARRLREGEGA